MSLTIYNRTHTNRMILGTALYANLDVMLKAINAAETEMVTVSLKRQSTKGGKDNKFWDAIKNTGCDVLPNTAGCRTSKEAVLIAEMGREIFNTSLVKLEVIGDDYTLQPNLFELVKATETLLAKGFHVLPYCTDDLTICSELVSLGCKVLMPLGSHIGSGQGLQNPYALKILRERYPELTLIIDAGLGTPSDAVQAMELGYDGILLNSAVALANFPDKMAKAFQWATLAGRLAFEAKRMPKRDFAQNSTPLSDTPFWHQHE
ncbi:thiazole synthase [Francisellaceae bacterium]|nr:thiazole synthase [Francisellaceae bacterium]